jgi:hypothetical protein
MDGLHFLPGGRLHSNRAACIAHELCLMVQDELLKHGIEMHPNSCRHVEEIICSEVVSKLLDDEKAALGAA